MPIILNNAVRTKIQEAVKSGKGYKINNLWIGCDNKPQATRTVAPKFDVEMPTTNVSLWIAQRDEVASPGGNPVPITLTDPAVETWFEQPFVLPIAANASLMDVVAVAGALPASFITDVHDVGGFLSSLRFHNQLKNEVTDSSGPNFWQGWSWTYFIGSPREYSIGYADADPSSPYPDLGLGDFTAAAVPFTTDTLNLYTGRNFTLSYEHLRVEW